MNTFYYISHVGVGRRDGAPGRGSGRYPLGSGDRPYQHLETGLKGAGKAVEGGKSTVSGINKIRQTSAKNKIDFSNMSDNELRKKINRMNMERQYMDLSYERSRGLEYVNNILDVAGGTVTVGAGIVTIAGAIYKIMHN